MPYIDIFILAVVGFFFVKGWLRGFFLEFFTFIGYIIAIITSTIIHPVVASYLNDWIGLPKQATRIVVFFLTFVVIAFAFGAIGRYISQKSKEMKLNHVNRTLGAFFGGAKASFAIGALLWVVMKQSISSGLGAQIEKGSLLAGIIMQFSGWLINAFTFGK